MLRKSELELPLGWKDGERRGAADNRTGAVSAM